MANDNNGSMSFSAKVNAYMTAQGNEYTVLRDTGDLIFIAVDGRWKLFLEELNSDSDIDDLVAVTIKSSTILTENDYLKLGYSNKVTLVNNLNSLLDAHKIENKIKTSTIVNDKVIDHYSYGIAEVISLLLSKNTGQGRKYNPESLMPSVISCNESERNFLRLALASHRNVVLTDDIYCMTMSDYADWRKSINDKKA